jgi:glycosyltransferase involved in cell wall biosynthesis
VSLPSLNPFTRRRRSAPSRPLRIALLAHGGTQWMGGELYVRNLFIALLRYREKLSSSQAYQLIVFTSDPPALLERHPAFLGADDVVACPHMNDGPIGRLTLFPRLLLSRIDFAYPCYSPLPPWPGLHGSGWMVDFQYEHYPSLFSQRELRRRRLSAALVARTMAHVVFSSRDALADFRHFFPDSRAQTHVLHFHSFPDPSLWKGDPDAIRIRYGLPSRFLICCGQFWAHKNHLLLLEALATALKEQPDLFLVFTGHPVDLRNPSHLDTLLSRLHLLGLRPATALLGLIPREDQLQLIRRAVAVVQPSLFEGWSTVVEDARALGKPIVLSDIPVHLEQKVPRAHVFSATSADALRQCLLESWRSYEAGPELMYEEEARAHTDLLCVQMAEDFLALMFEAIR